MNYENSMRIKYKNTIKRKLSHISDIKYGYVM